MRVLSRAMLVLLLGAPGIVAAQDPQAAYREAVDAFVRGDAAAYFDAFAPTLECFYERRSVPLAAVRRMRSRLIEENRARPGAHTLTVDSLEVALDGDDRVVLLDRGTWEGASHVKAVLMVRAGDGFVIAGEGGRTSRCFGELLRVETIGRPPRLASADGIFAALSRAGQLGVEGMADLAPPGRGILHVSVDGRRSRSWCRSGIDVPRGAARGELACNADLSRCALGDSAFLFAERDGRRELAAVVVYSGATAPPARDAQGVATLLERREQTCELHDRLLRTDLTLASEELWVLGQDGRLSLLCGPAALRASRALIRVMSHPPLACVPTRCEIDADSNGNPHVLARREGSALRVYFDGQNGLTGMSLRERDRERLRTEHCPAP